MPHPLEVINPELWAALNDDIFRKRMISFASKNWWWLESEPEDLVQEAVERILNGRRMGTWSKQGVSPAALIVNTIKSIASHEITDIKAHIHIPIDEAIAYTDTHLEYRNQENIGAEGYLQDFINTLDNAENQRIASLIYEGHKQCEIAKIIGKSDAYVSNVVKRIMQALKDYLSD